MKMIDDPEREDVQMIEEAMQNTLTPEAVAAIAYIGCSTPENHLTAFITTTYVDF